MTAARLLTHLRAEGIRLEARGDRLRFRPREACTPLVAALMREQKHQMLELLQADGMDAETRREVRRGMLDVANHFYAGGPLDWLTLDAIDDRLESAATLAEALEAAEDYIDTARQCAHQRLG